MLVMNPPRMSGGSMRPRTKVRRVAVALECLFTAKGYTQGDRLLGFPVKDGVGGQTFIVPGKPKWQYATPHQFRPLNPKRTVQYKPPLPIQTPAQAEALPYGAEMDEFGWSKSGLN